MLEISGGCLLRMVLTYVVMGASGGALAFMLNFAVAELISYTTAFLINKGAYMSNYIMEKSRKIRNKLGSRGFRTTC